MMGPNLATHIFQGAVEVIPMPAGDEPPPGVSNVNPVGAVDKKDKDKYRIIQDERLANLGVDDWGVQLFSVMELSMCLTGPGALSCTETIFRVVIMFWYAVALR